MGHAALGLTLSLNRTISMGGVQMTRLKPGFHDSNGEFVTADTRVKYGFGARHGTVNTVFQDGEAEVIFDDNGDLDLVKWKYLCKLACWVDKM